MIVLFAVFVDVSLPVEGPHSDSHLENGTILVKFHDT